MNDDNDVSLDLDDKFDVASLLLAANIPAESVGEIIDNLNWPEDD